MAPAKVSPKVVSPKVVKNSPVSQEIGNAFNFISNLLTTQPLTLNSEGRNNLDKSLALIANTLQEHSSLNAHIKILEKQLKKKSA